MVQTETVATPLKALFEALNRILAKTNNILHNIETQNVIQTHLNYISNLQTSTTFCNYNKLLVGDYAILIILDIINDIYPILLTQEKEIQNC